MALFGERKRLGDSLVEAGYITNDQLMQALEEQKSRDDNKKIGEILMMMNFISADDFAKYYSEKQGIPTATEEELKAYDERAIEIVGETLIKKHEILPFGFDPDNINGIKVATSDPMTLKCHVVWR